MKPSLSKETITASDDSSNDVSSSSESEKQPTSNSKTQKHTSKSKSKSKSKPRRAEPSSSKASEESGAQPSDSEPEVQEIQNVTKSKKSSEKKKKFADNHSTEPLVRAKPFHPPEGFQLIQKSTPLPSELTNAFSDLNGKQIWHITAPAAVPFSSIKELALDAVATGETILTHKGVDYHIREDQIGSDRTKNLLLPEKQGNIYRRHRMDVAQTFHLERIVSSPSQGLESQIEAMKKKTRPLPSQPKNLRMRYMPFGTSPVQTQGGMGMDDSETEITFKDPRGIKVDGETKKQKKKRKHPDTDSALNAKDGVETDTQSQGALPRKKSKKAHAHEDGSQQELRPSGGNTTKRGRDEKEETQKSSTKQPDRKAGKEEKKRKKVERGRAG